MVIEKISLSQLDFAGLDNAVTILRDGGTVCYPTDTCYGLSAIATDQKALENLYKIKRMPLDKPISVLVHHVEMARELVEISDKALEVINKFWPTPLTIILPKSKNCPSFLNPGLDSVAIRQVNDKISAYFCEQLGVPLLTTSANLHKTGSLYDSGEVVQEFEKENLRPDLILAAGKVAKIAPSTIIKVKGDQIEVKREGPILKDKF